MFFGRLWQIIVNLLQSVGISLPQINMQTISAWIANLKSTGPGTVLLVFLGIIAAILAVILVVILLLSIVWLICSAVLGFIQFYFIPAIGLCKMAKNAGKKHPWFAWVPLLQTHLEYTLPKRDFEIFFFRVKGEKRNAMAIVFTVLSAILPVVIFFIGKIPVVGGFLMMIPIILLILVSWRKKYDILMTFGKEEKAAAVAVIGTILPIVYAVALLIYRKRMPQYEKKSVVNPVWYIETPEKIEAMKQAEAEKLAEAEKNK